MSNSQPQQPWSTQELNKRKRGNIRLALILTAVAVGFFVAAFFLDIPT